MPYCVVADTKISRPATGVRQMVVEEMACQGLRCFYSEFQQRPENFTQQDALQFYGTVQAVFEKVAVIPFRFPTVLETKPQLTEFVEQKAREYGAALEKLRNFVQMELRIVPAAGDATPSTSGKQYMAQRLKSKKALELPASAARSAVAEICAEWRQQETREGLRCYALVARENIGRFQQKLATLSVEDNVRVTVSGPWPATEFIE